MRDHMFLQSISIFEAFMLHRDINLAAGKLGVEPEHLSDSLYLLEASLGVALIDWKARPPMPTALGIHVHDVIESASIRTRLAVQKVCNDPEYGASTQLLTGVAAFAFYLPLPT